jgi:hypothetical protein
VIGSIRILPFWDSNFRTFARQMFVAHLGNVCHCESGLQASSVVKFLVAQFRFKIASKILSKLDALNPK